MNSQDNNLLSYTDDVIAKLANLYAYLRRNLATPNYRFVCDVIRRTIAKRYSRGMSAQDAADEIDDMMHH